MLKSPCRSSRAVLIALLSITCPLISALPALAAPSVGSYGLGLMIGEPTGFSGAYVMDRDHVIDGALAYSYMDEADWQIQSDFLWRNNKLYTDQAPEVDFYYGTGLRLKFESSARLGVRIPVGATYQFGNDPIQFFGELAPILDVAPDLSMRVDISVGARYFF